jgi:hypothetical protein
MQEDRDFMLNVVSPGEIFEMDASSIWTLEGPMQGKATLRVGLIQGKTCALDIIGASKPEWEWMMGKVIWLDTAKVKEEISKQP